MPIGFVDNPVLNSPFREPDRHFHLNEDGTPTGTIDAGRRPSACVVINDEGVLARFEAG